MLRLSLLVLASTFAFTPYTLALNNSSQNSLAAESGLEQSATIDELIEFTELEHQLVEASGLLSLSQQVKYSAQRLIALSIEQPEADSTINADTNTSSAELSADKVLINHAQHFAIAKHLAKRWTEDQWQQRLLELIHDMPVATQKLIQQQLAHPMLKAAQRKERAAIGVQDTPAYQLYINKLRQQPPAALRWQLVESLDRQSGFSQMIIQARSTVIKQIQLQVKGWQPQDTWQKQSRQEVLEFLFYAYRTTPNTKLKHIADSFNQRELNQFYKDVRNAVH
ncbi:MAG: hypothetical protein V7765_15275 [Oleispira sp.]